MGIEDGSAQGHICKASCFFMHGETLQLNCGGQAVKPRWMLSKSFVADTAVICQELVSFPDLDTVGDRVMGLDPLGSSWVVKSPNFQTHQVYESNLKSAVFTSNRLPISVGTFRQEVKAEVKAIGSGPISDPAESIKTV